MVSLLILLIVLVTLTSVKFPIQRFGSPIQIICGISSPIGVAVRDSGEIVVVEYGNYCVSIGQATVIHDGMCVSSQYNIVVYMNHPAQCDIVNLG